MAIDVQALKDAADLVSVVGAYVTLKKRGSEYLGLCPFHDDHNASFYVVPAKRFCNCFSCGWSGDVLDFLQEKEGVDFKAACAMLGNGHEWKPRPITQAAVPLPDRVTAKPPADAPAPNFTVRGLGEPQATYAIRDLGGELLGYECRYAGEGGKKEIRVWTWGARGAAAPAWWMGHFNVPRPLYGLERLTAKPGAWVSIFEGPKKADAGERLLPEYACISWTGGANAWHKHEWAPLAGRSVLIWPDADAPGWAACEKLAAVLADPRGLACTVRIVDTHGEAEGWDVADFTGTPEELTAWARPRAGPYQHPAPQGGEAERPAEDAQSSPIPAAAGPPESDPSDFPPGASPARPRRARKPRLATVDGNTALAADPDAEPLPAALSDDQLADHLAETKGEDWRFVRPWGAWFQWDGDGWREDKTGLIDRACLQVTRQAIYWPDSASLSPDGRRKVNSRRTAGAVRDNAGHDRRCAATMDQWDADPWLLGCPGGVLDLRAGKMLEAERGQYITKRCAAAPDQGRPELWLEFLARITAGDDSLIGYLQRFAGYALTGETSEHSLVFLYGTGANGKTVFLQTLAGILGDYAVSAGIETFTETKNERHSTEIARLRGARLVVTEETDSGGRWAEGKIKRLTGGGKISAHFMRQDDFEFTPQFKLMIAGNHKPMLRSVDEAIRRRFHLIPFKVTIPIEDRDKHLFDKLREEWPQILGWMLDGCVAWQDASLGMPESIQIATDQYLEAEDVIGQWLDESCERTGRCESAAAYKNYSEWCDRQGERPYSRRAWVNALLDRGLQSARSSSARMIDGITLKLHEIG
jgi:putative DNA primase/helicase